MMSAYWIAVMGIYGIKSMHPNGTAATQQYLATGLNESDATWLDPVFHALPAEARRHIMCAIDPEFLRLSREDQYIVIAELARKHGPKPEVASALASAIRADNWIDLPIEPIDRIDNAVAQSIPYGIALTAFASLFSFGSWLILCLPISVVRPTGVTAGVVVLLGLTLCPPWTLLIKSGTGHILSTTYKYGWLFSPPTQDGDAYTTISLDWSRLMLEWLAAGIASAGAVYLIRSPRPVAAASDHAEDTEHNANSPS
jgi:hypothetical protein